MLSRWITQVNDINLALNQLERLAKHLTFERKGRGRKPKREFVKYAKLIVLKEYDERTLRGAEVHLSRLVCDERIDHSVIAYWENKEEMQKLISQFIVVAGALLQEKLSYDFTFVDSTKFTSWEIQEIEVTVCNRISQTVYPVGISFIRDKVSSAVDEAVPEGTGKLKADAWYDVNEVFKVLFGKGYIPIICPNKNRIDGFYRRKGRKLYRMRENRLAYRQRGRGESLFGSLTNQFGDRLNARKENVMKVRIASRVLCYQLKLMIRCQIIIYLLIIRHAHYNVRHK